MLRILILTIIALTFIGCGPKKVSLPSKLKLQDSPQDAATALAATKSYWIDSKAQVEEVRIRRFDAKAPTRVQKLSDDQTELSAPQKSAGDLVNLERVRLNLPEKSVAATISYEVIDKSTGTAKKHFAEITGEFSEKRIGPEDFIWVARLMAESKVEHLLNNYIFEAECLDLEYCESLRIDAFFRLASGEMSSVPFLIDPIFVETTTDASATNDEDDRELDDHADMTADIIRPAIKTLGGNEGDRLSIAYTPENDSTKRPSAPSTKSDTVAPPKTQTPKVTAEQPNSKTEPKPAAAPAAKPLKPQPPAIVSKPIVSPLQHNFWMHDPSVVLTQMIAEFIVDAISPVVDDIRARANALFNVKGTVALRGRYDGSLALLDDGGGVRSSIPRNMPVGSGCRSVDVVPDGNAFYGTTVTVNAVIKACDVYGADRNANDESDRLPEVVITRISTANGGSQGGSSSGHRTGLDIDIDLPLSFKDDLPKSSTISNKHKPTFLAVWRFLVILQSLSYVEDSSYYGKLVPAPSINEIYLHPKLRDGLCKIVKEEAQGRKITEIEKYILSSIITTKKKSGKDLTNHHDHLHVSLECPMSNNNCDVTGSGRRPYDKGKIGCEDVWEAMDQP